MSRRRKRAAGTCRKRVASPSKRRAGSPPTDASAGVVDEERDYARRDMEWMARVDDPNLVDVCDAYHDDENPAEAEVLTGKSSRRRIFETVGHRVPAMLYSEFGGVPSRYDVIPGSIGGRELYVIVARGALDDDGIAAIHESARHPSASKRVRHFIVPPYSARVERQLCVFAPAVLERLIALAEWADEFCWKALPAVVFPEAEYIVYEAPPDAAVGPHLDEDAALSYSSNFADVEPAEGGSRIQGASTCFNDSPCA